MTRQYDTSYWDGRRNKIRSKKGGWIIGEDVVDQGYSLLDDFPGQISFFQLLYLHVLNELPASTLATWLEASFMCLSYPDARLWCNQIGALGGSARLSPTSAVCAGVLASDSFFYGPGAVPAIVKFYDKARSGIASGLSEQEFVEDQCIKNGNVMAPGFSRPIARGDERVAVLRNLAQRLSLDVGPTEAMALRIGEHLEKRYKESINAAGLIVAFWIDRGLGADEICTLYSLAVNAGVHACYVEALNNPADSFLPLRCKDIVYTGPAKRIISKRNKKQV